MIVHATILAPERDGVVAICQDVAVDDDGAGGFAIDSHLVGGSLLDGATIIIIYGDAADDTVVGIVLQHDDPHVYGLTLILLDGLRCCGLGILDDDAVTVLAHEYYVGSVDNHCLMIQTITNEYLERFCWGFGSFLYGILYAFASMDNDIEVVGIGF